MEFNSLIAVFISLLAAIALAFLKPVFKLWNNWFYLTFSSKLELKIRKKKLAERRTLKQYKEELDKQSSTEKSLQNSKGGTSDTSEDDLNSTNRKN
ncbi:hypothetical protein LZY01_21210 [Levilactobacillus zymae]|uniref:Uncharacterized protein n=1 Tax=Levilactobacillus zymae TaxID=267363 RepID=A0ABQ0WZF5_9LACO|nr:hypothetical protein [Levilactobacillus zymae]QFR60569.1 hypothetical protein LZ395_03085 [Levilactobacillus zymae]GEO72953.1 hypothetical protein LZY01_21210 [Levilactobacillus zymae]